MKRSFACDAGVRGVDCYGDDSMWIKLAKNPYWLVFCVIATGIFYYRDLEKTVVRDVAWVTDMSAVGTNAMGYGVTEYPTVNNPLLTPTIPTMTSAPVVPGFIMPTPRPTPPPYNARRASYTTAYLGRAEGIYRIPPPWREALRRMKKGGVSAESAGILTGTVIADVLVFPQTSLIPSADDAVIVVRGAPSHEPQPDSAAVFTLFMPRDTACEAITVRVYNRTGKMSTHSTSGGFLPYENDPRMMRNTYTFPQFKQSEVLGMQVSVQ